MLQIDCAWFNVTEAPLTQYGRYKIAEDHRHEALASLIEFKASSATFFPSVARPGVGSSSLLTTGWPTAILSWSESPRQTTPPIWDIPVAEQRKAAASCRPAGSQGT